MKITLKLTILFTFITAGIVFVFAAVIYNYARLDREEEFYERIKIKSFVKGELLFDAKASPQILQEIHKNNLRVMNEAEIAIYDKDFNLLFHDNQKSDLIKETPQMLKEILDKGEIQFYQGKWQAVGERYTFRGKHYIITAISYDHFGYNKINNMYTHMVYAYIISIVVICFSGLFFSIRAFAPVKSITRKVNKITASKLDVRLDVNGSKDELSALANTFNQMLDRLESSFETQKSFVSNISHELRTPLAAIIAELELSLAKDRTPQAYREAIQNTLDDAKRLVRLSTSLLDLARAGYDRSEISFKSIRVDEVLLDARQIEQQANPNYNINIDFDFDPDDDIDITTLGNEYLLKVAFANLFNNGCKYSPNNQCSVTIRYIGKNIELQFCNQGADIPAEELSRLFDPFYRAGNHEMAPGNGIGLSLTKKIIVLHNGSIGVTSAKSLTVFTLLLPLKAI
jgi:signal transduction histidine kinase